MVQLPAFVEGLVKLRTAIGVAWAMAPLAIGLNGAIAAPRDAGRVASPACAWRTGEILDATGEIGSGGLTGRIERHIETGSGRLVETSDLGIGITRQGYDGRVAWAQDLSGGVHDRNSLFARRLAKSIAWLDGRQGCPATRRAGMAFLGNRVVQGKQVAAWKAAPAGGVPFELWYDRTSGRLDRAFFQMSESRLIRHFADWREIGGGRLAAFRQRDEFPEDEDEVSVRTTHAAMRTGAAARDFARPRQPNDVTFVGGRQSTSVRFEDDHRTRIYLPAYLNGQGPFLFELDNGGHNILTTETAQALGLAGAGSFSGTGAGNAVTQSGIARVARIQIGDAVITDQPMQIRKFDPKSNDRSPNAPRAGILGLELFERLLIAIDPDRKVVTLSRFGSRARPRGMPLPLVFAEDAPLVAGSFDGHAGDFMLDTGNAGPTIIEDYWARPLGLAKRLSGGVARGDVKVSTGKLGLGPVKLPGELVSYYGSAERGSEYSRAVAGVFGQPLLSRFKATYDYSRYTVWLTPAANAAPVAFDRSGLSLAKGDGGVFAVSFVMAGGPADEAGIRKGDLVNAIDGAPARSLSRADASAILRQGAGTTVTLAGTFGGAASSKRLRLRELIHP